MRTPDGQYVDVATTRQVGLRQGQPVEVRGVAAGETTIQASDGARYRQPLIKDGELLPLGTPPS